LKKDKGAPNYHPTQAATQQTQTQSAIHWNKITNQWIRKIIQWNKIVNQWIGKIIQWNGIVNQWNRIVNQWIGNLFHWITTGQQNQCILTILWE
jgi:hypothetical protein